MLSKLGSDGRLGRRAKLPSLTLPLFRTTAVALNVSLTSCLKLPAYRRVNRMQNIRGLVLGLLLAFQPLLNIYEVHAQPSPDLQQRISAAIAAAANQSHPDYTAFVNPFIGTGM